MLGAHLHQPRSGSRPPCVLLSGEFCLGEAHWLRAGRGKDETGTQAGALPRHSVIAMHAASRVFKSSARFWGWCGKCNEQACRSPALHSYSCSTTYQKSAFGNLLNFILLNAGTHMHLRGWLWKLKKLYLFIHYLTLNRCPGNNVSSVLFI